MEKFEIQSKPNVHELKSLNEVITSLINICEQQELSGTFCLFCTAILVIESPFQFFSVVRLFRIVFNDFKRPPSIVLMFCDRCVEKSEKVPPPFSAPGVRASGPRRNGSVQLLGFSGTVKEKT